MLDSFLRKMLGGLTVTVDHVSCFPTIYPENTLQLFGLLVWFQTSHDSFVAIIISTEALCLVYK